MNSTDTNSLTQAESNANTLLLLRSVIDSSLDSIQVFNSVKDATGKIIDFVWLLQNQKSQEQNGDVIGMSLIKKQPEVIPAGIFDKLRQVTESGQSQELEQYFPTKQFSGGLVLYGDGKAR